MFNAISNNLHVFTKAVNFLLMAHRTPSSKVCTHQYYTTTNILAAGHSPQMLLFLRFFCNVLPLSSYINPLKSVEKQGRENLQSVEERGGSCGAITRTEPKSACYSSKVKRSWWTWVFCYYPSHMFLYPGKHGNTLVCPWWPPNQGECLDRIIYEHKICDYITKSKGS